MGGVRRRYWWLAELRQRAFPDRSGAVRGGLVLNGTTAAACGHCFCTTNTAGDLTCCRCGHPMCLVSQASGIDPSRAADLAARIVADIMQSVDGTRAETVTMFSVEGRNLGSWLRHHLTDRIAQIIREADRG